MSNNKQSSVEWLDRWFRDNPEATHEEGNAALEQAKAMHKEEIIKARVDGDTWSTVFKEMRRNYAELYYNETFGGQQ